jgi:DNA-binding MarR family transcriptional regulator
VKNKVCNDEALDIMLLLRRTVDILVRARQKELLDCGITTANAAVLRILSDLGGSARPMEISLWLFRKRQSVHDLLDRMEKAGLIRKTGDTKRKNGVMVQITDQGRLLNERSSKLTLPATILSSLSTEEQHNFAGYLEILLKMGEKQMGVHDKMPLRPQTPLARHRRD